MLLLLGGCTDENPALSPAETVAPQPVPWAGVAVVDENTVVVRWRPSPSEGSQGFRSYYLVLQNMSRQAVVQRLEVTERRPLYELRFPRLNTGELYSLDIWVRFKDNVLSPAPRTLVFSPSVRYREIAGEPIRLYEQDAGAGLPKGFAFNRGGAPAVLPAANPGMVELWDLNFEIVDGVGYLGSTAATAVYAEDDSATAAQRNKAWRQRLQRAAQVGENVLLDVESLETLFLEAGLDTVGGRLERRMVRIPDRLPSGKGTGADCLVGAGQHVGEGLRQTRSRRRAHPRDGAESVRGVGDRLSALEDGPLCAAAPCRSGAAGMEHVAGTAAGCALRMSNQATRGEQ
jgi:hypothetical protein